ncbi:MAG: hypothetical protein JWN38_882 [Candidatus Saccharibacteria bacterium]|nr:hypothetical protein [Candidatus Saccharibacteria bacterium]
MPMTKQVTQFVAHSGKSFVYLTDMPFQDGQVLFSPDGITFYALASRGFGGTSIEHDLSFDDPHQGVSGKLHRNGDVIDYDDERYTQQDVIFDQSSVVPLPATRRPEYLCQAEDGTLFYVSADKYNYSYESFRLFVGDGTTMREIPVQDVERYRDGGTTYIRTPEETFFSPSPFNAQRDPNLVSQWGLQKLTNLNKGDYDIVETPEGQVSITKR